MKGISNKSRRLCCRVYKNMFLFLDSEASLPTKHDKGSNIFISKCVLGILI